MLDRSPRRSVSKSKPCGRGLGQHRRYLSVVEASMRIARLLTIAVFVAGVGCLLPSSAPKRNWVADFQKTDTILIRTHNEQYQIADAKTISRLRSIYENAKWKPYWHTLPASLTDRTIELLDGDTKLRHFSYTGSLWETESYTENRTAELSHSDAQWLESLFADVPINASSEASKKAK